jgi:hypothetical protein
MVTKVSWKVEESGMLVGARIHDSELIGFAITPSLEMKWQFRRLAGDTVEIVLKGVRDFNVIGLSNDAIAAEIFVWNVRSVPDAAWNVPDSGWNALFADRLQPQDRRRAAKDIMVASPEAYLVQLACSYGGSVAAVCESISIFEPASD